jgi:23S rRNA G2069 N7-methylase RlmK/C1962 C5-methylase RlmI
MKKQCKKVPFEIKKRENRLFEFLNDEVDCADDRKLDKEIVHKRDNNGKPVVANNLITIQHPKYSDILPKILNNLKKNITAKILKKALKTRSWKKVRKVYRLLKKDN